MLMKWTLGIVLLSTSLFSQAGLITGNVDAAVDSADMAGISVTAFFSNGTDQTLIWSDLVGAGTGVDNGTWSLKLQDGDTFGSYDNHNDTDPLTGTFQGLWTLTNLADFGITALSINAGLQGFYFDNQFGETASTPGIGEGTTGSGPGIEFDSSLSFTNNIAHSYDDLFSAPDLYGKLNISFINGTSLAKGESLGFLTDTDRVSVSVPEPATMFTFALGLIALTSLRRKPSGK